MLKVLGYRGSGGLFVKLCANCRLEFEPASNRAKFCSECAAATLKGRKAAHMRKVRVAERANKELRARAERLPPAVGGDNCGPAWCAPEHLRKREG